MSDSQEAAKRREWPTQIKNVVFQPAFWTREGSEQTSKPDPEKMNPETRTRYESLAEKGYGDFISVHVSGRGTDKEELKLHVTGTMTQITREGKELKQVFKAWDEGRRHSATDILEKMGPNANETDRGKGWATITPIPGGPKPDGTGNYNHLKILFAQTQAERDAHVATRPERGNAAKDTEATAQKPAAKAASSRKIDDEIPF